MRYNQSFELRHKILQATQQQHDDQPSQFEGVRCRSGRGSWARKCYHKCPLVASLRRYRESGASCGFWKLNSVFVRLPSSSKWKYLMAVSAFFSSFAVSDYLIDAWRIQVVGHGGGAGTSGSGTTAQQQAARKVTRMCMTITTTFTVAWLPYQLDRLALFFSGIQWSASNR